MSGGRGLPGQEAAVEVSTGPFRRVAELEIGTVTERLWGWRLWGAALWMMSCGGRCCASCCRRLSCLLVLRPRRQVVVDDSRVVEVMRKKESFRFGLAGAAILPNTLNLLQSTRALWESHHITAGNVTSISSLVCESHGIPFIPFSWITLTRQQSQGTSRSGFWSST